MSSERRDEAQDDQELGGVPAAEVVTTMAEYARELTTPVDEDERLELGVAMVVELMDSCDAAGVTMIEKGHLSTAAPTAEFVARADVLQHELREGPCVDTVRTQSTVISDDVGVDRRVDDGADLCAERSTRAGEIRVAVVVDGEHGRCGPARWEGFG